MSFVEHKRELLNDIRRFGEECQRTEYTDTDEAWKLLFRAQVLMAVELDDDGRRKNTDYNEPYNKGAPTMKKSIVERVKHPSTTDSVIAGVVLTVYAAITFVIWRKTKK